MKNCYAYNSKGVRCDLSSPETVWVNANYARRILGTQLIPSSIKRLKTKNGAHAWLCYQDILNYMEAEEKTRGLCCYAHCRKNQCKDTKYGLCQMHEDCADLILSRRRK